MLNCCLSFVALQLLIFNILTQLFSPSPIYNSNDLTPWPESSFLIVTYDGITNELYANIIQSDPLTYPNRTSPQPHLVAARTRGKTLPRQCHSRHDMKCGL